MIQRCGGNSHRFVDVCHGYVIFRIDKIMGYFYFYLIIFEDLCMFPGVYPIDRLTLNWFLYDIADFTLGSCSFAF